MLVFFGIAPFLRGMRNGISLSCSEPWVFLCCISVFTVSCAILNRVSALSMPSNENVLPEARRFLVRGRVQGVGFRWFVEREAHTLGIAGWVRNNADGSVEVLAMGTRDQLSGLRSRLHQGPRASRVDEVEESDAKPVAGLSTFRIEGAW